MALESGAEESVGSSDRVIILVHTNTISSSFLCQERAPTGCSFFKSNQQQFRRFNRARSLSALLLWRKMKNGGKVIQFSALMRKIQRNESAY
jgi:hypothetical protein